MSKGNGVIGEGSIINNRFRLDRLLGRGGFAQVFLCTDQVLGRQVAIKVLNPTQAAPGNFDFIGRFQGEARAVAALDHPNILGVYDFGEVEGTVYLVMPFINGGTLDDRISGGRILPLREVAEYLRQTAEGLDYAHRRGIVHRDIKPQNLLIRAEDNRLLIADFGIAKVMQGSSAQTQTAAIGTVAYMAPEQLEGRAAPSIDIYALGCVLFQLLTGRVPYGGPATQAMYSHMSAPIPSVQERSEGRLPVTFQPLIDRALAKRPEARFASAGELARSFEALLATITAPLPPPATATAPTTSGQPRTDGSGAHAAPPPSLPVVPTTPPAVTVVAPSGPPPYTPVPAPQPTMQPDPAAARRTWLLLVGIGALVVIVILLGALLINLFRPEGNTNATPTVSPGAALATATTGTSGFVTVTATVPIVTTPVAASSAPASASAQPTRSPTAGASSAQPSAATSPATATATRAPGITPTVAPATIERGSVLRGHTDHVRAVAWLGERQRLISGGGDGTVRLWLTDGTLLNTFAGQTQAVTSIAVSPDRSMIAVGSDDFRVHIWRSDGTELRVLSGHTNFVTSVAWSPDSKQIVSGSYDRTVRIWAVDGSGSRTLSGHSDVVLGVAWSSTGRIASASWDKTIRLWNADGTAVRVVEGHTDQVFTVAWSPDGQILASGSVDKSVRLWRADGTPVATLPGHTAAVSSVGWSLDGAMLASGSFDKTVRLWSATGQPIGSITEHTDAVTAIAWGPENGQLATASWDMTVRLWRVRR